MRGYDEMTTMSTMIADITAQAATEAPNYTGVYIAIGITVLAFLFCGLCIILICCGCGWWCCCDEDDWEFINH